MTDELTWEDIGAGTLRLKVDGGHIYCLPEGVCFVPEIDLTRYQSHLRDAYHQGFKDGQDDVRSHTSCM